MKTIIRLSLFILLISCTSQRNIINEDTLYVTRKYVGDFIELRIDKKVTHILTTEAVFYIMGKPRMKIPVKSKCYVKYIAERLPGSHTKVWILYFTWDDTEDLYMLKQNWITGEIY